MHPIGFLIILQLVPPADTKTDTFLLPNDDPSSSINVISTWSRSSGASASTGGVIDPCSHICREWDQGMSVFTWDVNVKCKI